MNTHDPLQEFEALTVWLTEDVAPPVDVRVQVLRRVRMQVREDNPERTAMLMALGSFVATVLVSIIGLLAMSGLDDALEGFFEIIPPISL